MVFSKEKQYSAESFFLYNFININYCELDLVADPTIFFTEFLLINSHYFFFPNHIRFSLSFFIFFSKPKGFLGTPKTHLDPPLVGIELYLQNSLKNLMLNQNIKDIIGFIICTYLYLFL
ncbi:hypothetical protein HanIR_Chr01g0013541 [Helianthus annuus]|nr:hypothetical protein HanIR_Chr01g0013541 [Helianthus annuus]